MEFPAAAHGVESGAGARVRQHGHHQAGDADAADRAGARRHRERGGTAFRRPQRDHRSRIEGRADARRSSGHRQDRVHRRHVDRTADHEGIVGDAEAHHPRARRQVAEHRLSRCRSRRRDPRRDDGHLLWQRRSLRSRIAASRRQIDQERVRRQGRRACEEDGAGRSAGSQNASRRDLVEEAARNGSALHRDGEEGRRAARRRRRPRRHRHGKGYFLQPTVFDNVTPDMTIAREEIFGPVLAAIEFADVDEAIARANDSPYGLAAAVWTKDIKKAHYVARKLQAGTVWINTYNIYDTAAPFGGYKQSGFGREMSVHALEHYTQVKSVWVDLNQ